LQVAVTCLASLLGGGDQCRGALGGAQWPCVDDFVDPGGAGSLDQIRIELRDLTQHRHDQVALTELEGEFRRGEQPPGALPGRAQLRCPLQRGDRDSQGATPPRAPGCLL
jgi:hypothetical protein